MCPLSLMLVTCVVCGRLHEPENPSLTSWVSPWVAGDARDSLSHSSQSDVTATVASKAKARRKSRFLIDVAREDLNGSPPPQNPVG
jgi:hypothetical protein